MTTPMAAKLYETIHIAEHAGTPYAVFNPQSLPIEDLPVIYGFNNGGSPGWYSACLLAEDGTPLGGHLCSSEGYMRHDLGIYEGSRPDRHERFREHYPDGYRMTFVPYNDVEGHDGLMRAITLANQKADDGKNADAMLAAREESGNG